MCDVMARWSCWPPADGRIPYGRGVSTEQRWQDLASLLSLQGAQGEGAAAAAAFGHPFPPSATHQPHHNYGYDVSSSSSAQPPRSVVLHNATLAPPMGDLNSSAAYQGLSMGSAVATSMSLNLNSSEPMGDSAPPSACKMETPHDMLFYQNSSTAGELGQLGPLGQLGQLGQLNSTTEGFLSSILEDSDLQLTMDMAMNEGRESNVSYEKYMRMRPTTQSTLDLSGMYPMRMLESNSSNNASSIAGLSMGSPSIAGGPLGVTNMTGATGPVGSTEERLDASSDSAVSSMGSERVASLSDGGEWMETGSDSGHTANDHYHLDYSHSKYRPPEYGNYMVTPGSGEANHRIQQPVAQKKHQMYGKRYFQGEQAGVPPLVGHGSAATPTSLKYEYGEASPRPAAVMPGSVNMGMASSNSSAFAAPLEDDVKTLDNKYSCGLEFARQASVRHSMEHVAHNHSYHLPPLPESPTIAHHPVTREKPKGREGRKSEESHLTRDEKRARALNVPISVDDIINLPMDEFNERLSKFDLSEAQLSLIRDIRRRGKNKVAAQNCRKRKLDQIVTLADEVQHMREMKQQLNMEHDKLTKERARMKEKFSQLYSHVFQNLRDPDGNPYSVYEYSLQQSAEGTVVLVPRTGNSSTLLETPSQLGAHPHSHAHAHTHSHSHPHPHPHPHPHSQSHQLPHHNIPHQLPHGHGHSQADRHKEHLPHHPHPHSHPHQPHPHSHHKE